MNTAIIDNDRINLGEEAGEAAALLFVSGCKVQVETDNPSGLFGSACLVVRDHRDRKVEVDEEVVRHLVRRQVDVGERPALPRLSFFGSQPEWEDARIPDEHRKVFASRVTAEVTSLDQVVFDHEVETIQEAVRIDAARQACVNDGIEAGNNADQLWRTMGLDPFPELYKTTTRSGRTIWCGIVAAEVDGSPVWVVGRFQLH